MLVDVSERKTAEAHQMPPSIGDEPCSYSLCTDLQNPPASGGRGSEDPRFHSRQNIAVNSGLQRSAPPLASGGAAFLATARRSDRVHYRAGLRTGLMQWQFPPIKV